MKKVSEEWKANKEIINFKNSEGWETYKTATDNAANGIAEIANNKELTIDEVREKTTSYKGSASGRSGLSRKEHQELNQNQKKKQMNCLKST